MPMRNFQLGVAVALLLGLLFAMPAAAQRWTVRALIT